MNSYTKKDFFFFAKHDPRRYEIDLFDYNSKVFVLFEFKPGRVRE